MGGGQSPALAGRYGTAFVRLLRETYPEIFDGAPRSNCWRAQLTGGNYDPSEGFGMVWYGDDGLPAVQCWVFCDDFCIHGPTFEKTSAALSAFLDLTVKVGLLCHPGKLTPPCQQAKYIGFILDTRGTPALRIPELKKDKAQAMISYFLEKPPTFKFSGLCLAVMAGTLEALVEATPSRMGRLYLRNLHTLLGVATPSETNTAASLPDPEHPGEGTNLPQYYKRYYQYLCLTEAAREDLQWWQAQLHQDCHHSSFSPKAGVLNPTWGDGSGTGTGGTMEIQGLEMKLWMGSWTPRIAVFSSNWRELRTLGLTLEQLLDDPQLRKATEDTTVFYFTDNLVTYYVVNGGCSRTPSLHELVRAVKLAAQKLGIRLEVIHVPGTAMILQGTDGHSRGVWVSPYHNTQPGQHMTAAVFAPVPPHPDLPLWSSLQCGLPDVPAYCDWNADWWSYDVMDHLTL
jgi:hypothetical protein